MPEPESVFAPPPEPVPFVPDPRSELPAGAEAIVVGAGMVGASAAYHLARAGIRPLVIEANAPAWGASGRNAGMALAGLGGHWHPYAPILGQLIAELMADGHASTLPLEPFDPQRYVGVTHEPTWLEPFGGQGPIPR